MTHKTKIEIEKERKDKELKRARKIREEVYFWVPGKTVSDKSLFTMLEYTIGNKKKARKMKNTIEDKLTFRYIYRQKLMENISGESWYRNDDTEASAIFGLLKYLIGEKEDAEEITNMITSKGWKGLTSPTMSTSTANWGHSYPPRTKDNSYLAIIDFFFGDKELAIKRRENIIKTIGYHEDWIRPTIDYKSLGLGHYYCFRNEGPPKRFDSEANSAFALMEHILGNYESSSKIKKVIEENDKACDRRSSFALLCVADKFKEELERNIKID
jgi:hypothetical protein